MLKHFMKSKLRRSQLSCMLCLYVTMIVFVACVDIQRREHIELSDGRAAKVTVHLMPPSLELTVNNGKVVSDTGGLW